MKNRKEQLYGIDSAPLKLSPASMRVLKRDIFEAVREALEMIDNNHRAMGVEGVSVMDDEP